MPKPNRRLSGETGATPQTLVAVDTDHVGLTHFKSPGSAEFVAIAKLIQATIEKSDVVPEILLDPITRGKTSNFAAGSSTRTRIQRQKEALLEAGSERAFNVLVCGVATDGKSPASKAASELARMLTEENFSVRIAGEVGLQDKEFYRNSNPIQKELEYVKSECNAVVIIAEKADSWTELGLFGWHFATDRKLRDSGLDFILLVDNQHKSNKFINDGPFSLIHAHGYAQYFDVTELDLNLIVDRLKSRRSVFTVDRRGRRKIAHD